MLLTAVEVARLVGRSERRVRGWIEKGRLPAQKLDGVWRIEKDVALEVAEAMAQRGHATPAPSQRAPEGIDDILQAFALLGERVGQLEARIETLAADLAALRVQNSLKPSVARLEAQEKWAGNSETYREGSGGWKPASAFSARQSPAGGMSAGAGMAGGALPGGLVVWRAFVREHGIRESTIQRHVEGGVLPVVRGRWQVGRAIVEQAFDATGRREFWRLYHTHQNFQPCAACPHTVPTMPVPDDALAGVDARVLAELLGEADESGEE